MTVSFLPPPPPQPSFTFVRLDSSASHLYFSVFKISAPLSHCDRLSLHWLIFFFFFPKWKVVFDFFNPYFMSLCSMEPCKMYSFYSSANELQTLSPWLKSSLQFLSTFLINESKYLLYQSFITSFHSSLAWLQCNLQSLLDSDEFKYLLITSFIKLPLCS